MVYQPLYSLYHPLLSRATTSCISQPSILLEPPHLLSWPSFPDILLLSALQLPLCRTSPLPWTTRKQDVTTLSSTEAEYIALGMGAQDAMWLRKILAFLSISAVPGVWTDNHGAFTLLYNPDFFHKCTKQIRRCHRFVRECAEEGDITVH